MSTVTFYDVEKHSNLNEADSVNEKMQHATTLRLMIAKPTVHRSAKNSKNRQVTLVVMFYREALSPVYQMDAK